MGAHSQPRPLGLCSSDNLKRILIAPIVLLLAVCHVKCVPVYIDHDVC